MIGRLSESSASILCCGIADAAGDASFSDGNFPHSQGLGHGGTKVVKYGPTPDR